MVGMCFAGLPVARAPLWQIAQVPGATPTWLNLAGGRGLDAATPAAGAAASADAAAPPGTSGVAADGVAAARAPGIPAAPALAGAAAAAV